MTLELTITISADPNHLPRLFRTIEHRSWTIDKFFGTRQQLRPGDAPNNQEIRLKICVSGNDKSNPKIIVNQLQRLVPVRAVEFRTMPSMSQQSNPHEFGNSLQKE